MFFNARAILCIILPTSLDHCLPSLYGQGVVQTQGSHPVLLQDDTYLSFAQLGETVDDWMPYDVACTVIPCLEKASDLHLVALETVEAASCFG